jgi:hypothetical protein
MLGPGHFHISKYISYPVASAAAVIYVKFLNIYVR